MSAPRICVIGNSHVACVKLALAETPATTARIDFFAASANLASRLRLVESHHLRPDTPGVLKQISATSGGLTQIDIRLYDAFVFMGISFEYRDFLRLFRTHCLYRHREWLAGRDLISDDGFADFQKSLYAYRPTYRLAREIATVRPGVPLLIAAAPFPVDGMLDAKAFRFLRKLRGTPYFGEIAEIYRHCAAAAAESVGARASFQRPRTLAAPGFTRPDHNSRSVGLTGPRRLKPGIWSSEKTGPDPWHMNMEFGRLRLGDILEGLGLEPPAAAMTG